MIDSQRDQYLLVDQRSLNGTYLNGQKVSCSPLNAGDQISAGDTMFSFVSDEDAQKQGGMFGKTVHDYRIEHRLGRGTMSTVYLATHLPIVMLTQLGAQMLADGIQPECVDFVLAKPTTQERIQQAFQIALNGVAQA